MGDGYIPWGYSPKTENRDTLSSLIIHCAVIPYYDSVVLVFSTTMPRLTIIIIIAAFDTINHHMHHTTSKKPLAIVLTEIGNNRLSIRGKTIRPLHARCHRGQLEQQ